MERYDYVLDEIDGTGMRGWVMKPTEGGKYVLYADAQATVEALQAQVKGYQTKTYCAFCGQTYDIDTGAELIAAQLGAYEKVLK